MEEEADSPYDDEHVFQDIEDLSEEGALEDFADDIPELQAVEDEDPIVPDYPQEEWQDGVPSKGDGFWDSMFV